MCDAIEFAVPEMKKGEISVVTCTKVAKAGSRSLCAEAGIGLKDLKCEKVVLTLELEDFGKP
eukprot:9696834-Heterocapsa_arctica.AAC.1